MSLSSVVFALSAFVLLPANRKTHKNILPITINNSTGAGRAHRQRQKQRLRQRQRQRREESLCEHKNLQKEAPSAKFEVIVVACCLLPLLLHALKILKNLRLPHNFLKLALE